MKKYISIACVVLALAACKKNEVPDKPETPEEVTVTLNGTVAESIDGISANWANDAQISAFVGFNTTEHQRNVLYSASSVNGTSATFETIIKKVEEQTKYVAVYPYSTANTYDVDNGTVGISLPSKQNYVANGVEAGLLPLVASSTTKDLSFKQVCGVFRIALTGNAAVKVNSIEIEALKVAGAATVNTTNNAISMADNASDKINYTIPSPVALGEAATVFNVVLPPAQYSTIYYIVYAEDGTQMSSFDENVTITRGGVTTAAVTAYVADGSGADVTDLSDSGYANCYVVTAPGDYSFETVIPDAKKTVATGTSAKWVWATSGTWDTQEEASAEKMIKDIAYDSEKNVISFSVPEDYTYGSVLVALLDADGNINYSWHIWFTSRINDVTVNGITVMDRNLGSGGVLEAGMTDQRFINNAAGVMYQWGRKEPHLGPRGFFAVKESTAFEPGSSAYSVTNSGIKNVTAYPADGASNPWTYGKYDLNESLSLIMNAVQHPCTLIDNTNQATLHPAYGLTEWAAEADPCPFGYHVLKSDDMKALFAESVNVEVTNTQDDANMYTAVLDKTLVFPGGGYRNQAKGDKTYDIRIWTRDHTSTNGAHGVWGQVGPTTAGYVNHLKLGNANEIHSAFIRCEKD